THHCRRGFEIVKSDGTSSGTVLVKDINPGSASSTPSSLTNVFGALYFVADDGSTGSELWRSDGTSAGTVRLADINPGLPSSSPSNLTVAGSTLFFRATDGSVGFELF